MKTLTTILSAALIAGSCTIAMAQSAGGGAGSDVNPDRLGKGADQNPTGPAANPAAGTQEATTPGTTSPGTPRPAAKAPSGMATAPMPPTTAATSAFSPSIAPMENETLP